MMMMGSFPSKCKTTSISGNKIYHYHLNLRGSVSARRLTRLPSIPKNDAKFSGTEVCLSFSETIDALLKDIKYYFQKVRSLTLDVKVWESSIVELFRSLGNACYNSVWEAVKVALSSGTQNQKRDSVMAKSLKEQAFATPEAMAELVQRYIQLFSKNFCCDSKEETLFTEPINKNNSFQTYQDKYCGSPFPDSISFKSRVFSRREAYNQHGPNRRTVLLKAKYSISFNVYCLQLNQVAMDKFCLAFFTCYTSLFMNELFFLLFRFLLYIWFLF